MIRRLRSPRQDHSVGQVLFALDIESEEVTEEIRMDAGDRGVQVHRGEGTPY
jgi:hypothetical protein